VGNTLQAAPDIVMIPETEEPYDVLIPEIGDAEVKGDPALVELR